MDSRSAGGLPAAEWYADPAGRHQYRYWDGVAWTDNVADDGRQSTDPLSQVPRQGPPPHRQPSLGICESCQARISSGRLAVFFAGRGVSVHQTGIQVRRTVNFTARSYVYLCERCFKSPSKRGAAIRRKIADIAPGAGYYEAADFLQKFALNMVHEHGYVRIRDIMRDDLARQEAAGDATLVFVWKGMSLIEDAVLMVKVDGYWDGIGSLKKGFTSQLHVPAGVHKVSIRPSFRSSEVSLSVEPDAAYEVDITYSRTWGKCGFEVKRTA